MEKLKLKYKIAYGITGIGDSALYALMGNFAIYFLTIVAGVNPAVAGMIAAIGSIWETLCGASIGHISDNTCSKSGKRKPFILVAAFPLAILTSLFFTSTGLEGTSKVIYYGIILVLFWTAFTTFFIPYLAWGSELTQDYNERTVLRGYVFFFNAIGMAIGMALPTVIVEFMTQHNISVERSWQFVGISCGLCSALTIFIGAYLIKDSGETKERRQKTNKHLSVKNILHKFNAVIELIKNYLEILKLKCVRYILLASITYLTAHAAFCANRMYFFTYNIGLSSRQITIVMLILTFASVAFLPAVLLCNKFMDKKFIYISGMGACAVIIIFLGIIGINSFNTVCIFCIAYCIGSISYWQLIPSMIYDVCEVDQLINNTERSGTVISLQSLAESFANAIGLQLFGLFLALSGFNGSLKIQSESALTYINCVFSVIPAIMMIVSIIFVFKYPLTKKMHNRVLNALKKKNEGEEVDLSPFERLK